MLYIVSPCQTFVLKGFSFTSVSESLMDGWRYASKTTSTLAPCSPTHCTMDKTYSTSCANVLLFPFIHCKRSIPSMIQVDGVGIASGGYTFFPSSLANAALFFFHRDPSAFASAHGRGPVGGPGHPSCLHFCSQLPGSSD